jgi:hypothetical protein
LQKAAGDPSKIGPILDELAEVAQRIAVLLGGVNCGSTFSEWDKLIAPGTGTLNARTQPVTPSKDPCVIPPGGGFRRLENQLYRVEIHEEGSLGKATFKWSRENGSIVTAWTGQSGPNNEYLTVASTGRDSVLGFAGGQWVELTDDKHELDGTPGTLVRLVKVEGQTLTIDPATAIPTGASIKRSDFAHNPKVRRWESTTGAAKVEIPSTNDGWIPLEDGVEVKFSNGTYHTGEYWLIPARTEGGEIEWPPFQSPNTNPIPQPPAGIQHHYCRLALIYLDTAGKLHVLADCRDIFPPLTGLINFYFVGGDGQEAMPDLTQPGNLIPLAEPLQVGVSNWRWPVAGATVLFKITQGNGQLQNTGSIVQVQTGIDGIASCTWKLDSTTQDQQVEATLLDKNGQPMQVPVRFHANLSVAGQVAYNPGQCGTLQNQKTVQSAIDRLSQLVSLFHVSGDGQEVMPGEKLQPLVVQAASPCGPIEGVKVRFEIKSGNGKVNGSSVPVELTTIAGGIAQCEWTLDDSTPNQEVEARLLPDSHTLTPPTSVRFTANLSVARHVSYDPAKCSGLADVHNVQDAIDKLCQRQVGGGCSVTVGQGGQYDRLDTALTDLINKGNLDICICLMPGDHDLSELNVDGQQKPLHIKITGCGLGTRIQVKEAWKVVNLASFTLRDVLVQASGLQEFMVFIRCAEVTLESCHLRLTAAQPDGFLCSMAGAARIHLANNVMEAYTDVKATSTAKVLAGLNADLANLVAIQDPQVFNLKVAEAAQRLATLQLPARQNLVKGLQTALKDVTLTEAEHVAYTNLAKVMLADAVNAQALAGVLGAIRNAADAAVPATALIIGDSNADTALRNNEIRGVVSLYGPPGSEHLTPGELDNVPKVKDQEGMPLPNPGAALQLDDNHLTRLTVGADTLKIIKDALAKGEPETLPRVFRSGFFTNNVMALGENILVAKHLALTSNWFELTDVPVAALCIADAATYTGNHGRDGNVTSSTLYNLAGFSLQAANLLTFVG